MSKEDVKKYFQILVEDQEFVKKIIDTGEDKKAKMEVVKSYGMDFTKEEFTEIAQECKKVCEENGIDIEKAAHELDDKLLENVAGGFIASAAGGAAVGAYAGAIAGGCLNVAFGLPLMAVTGGASAVGSLAMTEPAMVGGGIVGALGFLVPFF